MPENDIAAGRATLHRTHGIDDLPALMREWAEWIHSLEGLGFSGSTPEWRATWGYQDAVFGSSLPTGLGLLEVRGALRRLIDAMDALLEDEDTRRPVVAVQHLYLWGPDDAIRRWGGDAPDFFDALKDGERIIAARLRA